MKIKLSLPTSVTLPRKTKKDQVYRLNLNSYRNWHFLINNEIKKIYKNTIAKILTEQNIGEIPDGKIQIVYCFFSKNKIRKDLSNCCVVIDKFFTDALVELGYIQDDSTDFVDCVVYKFSGIDKDNPRCDVIITDTINHT